MGSVTEFLPGLAAGSAAVNTGSDVVDGGADIVSEVVGFFGDIVENIFGAVDS